MAREERSVAESHSPRTPFGSCRTEQLLSRYYEGCYARLHLGDWATESIASVGQSGGSPSRIGEGLLVSQRGKGIHPRGTSGRDVTGKQGDKGKE